MFLEIRAGAATLAGGAPRRLRIFVRIARTNWFVNFDQFFISQERRSGNPGGVLVFKIARETRETYERG